MDYLDLRQQGDGNFVEAIKDGEIIRIPEKVAILEDLFILRKISNPPIQNMNVPVPSQNSSKSRDANAKNNSIMYDWKHGKFGQKKNNAVNDLITNFNWEISKNRKAKNMTRAKLAQLIDSNEENVKMIELGELPSDDFVLISRIENVFGINLRKNPGSIAQVSIADLQKRNEAKKEVSVFKDSSKFSGNDIEILE